MGTRCRSEFLENYGSIMRATGTCYGKSNTEFYSRANKDKDQDKLVLKKDGR